MDRPAGLIAFDGPQRLEAPHRFASLPPEERAVLELALSGLPNKAIALRLGASHRTVERRRSGAMRRLGVRTLVEAAAVVESGRARDAAAAARPASLAEHAFRGAAVGLKLVAPDGRLAAVNAAFCRITGRQEEDLVGRELSFVTHPYDLEASLTHVGRLFAARSDGVRMRKRYVRPGGEVVAADLTVTVVRRPGGGPEHAMGIVTAVTAVAAVAPY